MSQQLKPFKVGKTNRKNPNIWKNTDVATIFHDFMNNKNLLHSLSSSFVSLSFFSWSFPTRRKMWSNANNKTHCQIFTHHHLDCGKLAVVWSDRICSGEKSYIVFLAFLEDVVLGHAHRLHDHLNTLQVDISVLRQVALQKNRVPIKMEDELGLISVRTWPRPVWLCNIFLAPKTRPELISTNRYSSGFVIKWLNFFLNLFYYISQHAFQWLVMILTPVLWTTSL